MSENVRITVLVENSVHRQGLVAEHGLSFHIQIGQRSLLFDTGQSDLALINAETLHIPLDRLEAIVLSHGHYDHTGGLSAILDAAPNAPVYAHPAAFGMKYTKSPDSQSRFIGMSLEATHAIRRATGGVIETRGRTDIVRGVFVTGEIPRLTPYEDPGGPFFLDAACTQLDLIRDDQSLVIDLGRSVVLLLGCAHAGVVNILDHVRQLTSGKPMCALIGGLHLGSAREERIEQTVDRLRAANLDYLAPIHCTGWPATARLWQAFPNICRPAGVGGVFEFKQD